MPYKAHEPRRHKVPRARFKLIVEGVSKRFLSKRATAEALEIASGPSTNTCTGRTKDTHTIRATCGVLWRAWSDGVVPLRVELVALDIEARHLLVANLDPLRIAPRVQHAVHCQPARRRGRGNQIHDGRMADERAASPIL